MANLINQKRIDPLGGDLSLLTPRTYAKNVAELDALRSRVLELEHKLLQHDVQTLTPSPSVKKLPPLAPDTSVQRTHVSSVPNEPELSTIPTSSPAKIVIDTTGDTVFTVSQRNRLYESLKRMTGRISIKEDDLILLKKMVDGEQGDVIAFLLQMEQEESSAIMQSKLQYMLQYGSPAKYVAANRSSPQHPVWGIHYPLQKIARNLELLGSSQQEKLNVIVLVSSGAYNPIHMLHLRAFYVARQYVESNYRFPVVGAFFSPSHDTYVRVKNRRTPHEMIPRRHRLGLAEAAVSSSSWIEVDKWEITRRRVLDYLSTLTHVREMCESHFPSFHFHIMYVCGCNTVVKLSHSALREEGFGCITICRPTQTAMVTKQLGKGIAKTISIVEDTGVLPVDLERATSFRVRQLMNRHEFRTLEMMIGKAAVQYLNHYSIPEKVAGRIPWSEEDKTWRDVDLAYVEYLES